jgi:predicted esterase YcpF (UPF0227 family)
METNTTTIPPDYINPYHPISQQDFIEIKAVVDNITSHMPEDKANLVWNIYNAIRGVNERQPCTCGSSGRYWGEAIAAIRLFIKDRV